MKKISELIMAMSLLPAVAMAQSDAAKNNSLATSEAPSVGLSVEGYGETAAVHDGTKWATQNPHVLMGFDHSFPDGWSAFGEVEYADDALYVTQLFVQKTFSDHATIRLGKMTAPIGMANIYDNPTDHFSVSLPTFEDAVLPADCNLIGASLSGSVRKWRYVVMVAPLPCPPPSGREKSDSTDEFSIAKHSCSPPSGGVGGGAWGVEGGLRLSYSLTDNLTVAATGFYDKKITASTDINYNSDSFIAHAIATYSQRNEAVHAGIEAGYNIKGFVPFVRYDLLHNSNENLSRATVGLNFRPLENIAIKAEYARNLNAENENEFAIGIGISF